MDFKLWIKTEPIEFYYKVMNNVIIDRTIYTEINNISYFYNSAPYYKSLTYVEWTIDDTIIDQDKFNGWKFNNLEFLSKEELTEHFKTILRKNKLMKIKEKI